MKNNCFPKKLLFYIFKTFFLSCIYLSNFYTPCGARTHVPEIKSCVLFQLSQPSTSHFQNSLKVDRKTLSTALLVDNWIPLSSAFSLLQYVVFI